MTCDSKMDIGPAPIHDHKDKTTAQGRLIFNVPGSPGGIRLDLIPSPMRSGLEAGGLGRGHCLQSILFPELFHIAINKSISDCRVLPLILCRSKTSVGDLVLLALYTVSACQYLLKLPAWSTSKWLTITKSISCSVSPISERRFKM